MTITDFLLARIIEDEEGAREANYDDDDKPMPYHVVDDDWRFEIVGTNTARVLAECEAKRRIVDLRNAAAMEAERAPAGARGLFLAQVSAYDAAIRALASVYADHPDHDTAQGPARA